MSRKKKKQTPNDPRGLPPDEAFTPEERARRWAELGRVLLGIARREGLLPPEERPEERRTSDDGRDQR